MQATSRGYALATGTIVLALGLVLAGVLIGRATAAKAGPDQYADGLKVGRASGLAEGRALQVGAALPVADRKDAEAQFRAGYKAGAEDVFVGYDGGWVLGRSYVIVLGPGVNGLTYRISHREELSTTVRP